MKRRTILCLCGHEFELHSDDCCTDEDCYCEEFEELTAEHASIRDGLISILRNLKNVVEDGE